MRIIGLLYHYLVSFMHSICTNELVLPLIQSTLTNRDVCLLQKKQNKTYSGKPQGGAKSHRKLPRDSVPL